MNKLIIIGNLTRDPELRTTGNGLPVCNFTVAVQKKTAADHPEADFFRVTAWRGLAENCGKYLRKGSQCFVLGEVGASAYMSKEGTPRASLEIRADTVKFLSSPHKAEEAAPGAEASSGYVQVEDDELPF